MSYAPLDSESLFSSAFMAGPLPWAVWTAILASKDKDGLTSLNPEALARMWRIETKIVKKAWKVHTDPDPNSKNKDHQGARLIPTPDGRWFVVGHEQYRDKYREEKRREQLRLAKQRQRAKEKASDASQSHEAYQGPSPEEAKAAFTEDDEGGIHFDDDTLPDTDAQADAVTAAMEAVRDVESKVQALRDRDWPEKR